VDGWYNQSREMGRCHPTGVPTKCRSLYSADCPLDRLDGSHGVVFPSLYLCDSGNLTLSLWHYSKLGLVNNNLISLLNLSPPLSQISDSYLCFHVLIRPTTFDWVSPSGFEKNDAYQRHRASVSLPHTQRPTAALPRPAYRMPWFLDICGDVTQLYEQRGPGCQTRLLGHVIQVRGKRWDETQDAAF
jgi:hypothetical protein